MSAVIRRYRNEQELSGRSGSVTSFGSRKNAFTARPIQVLAFMEASWVSGPAKNIISFATRSLEHRDSSLRPVEVTIATFERGRPSTPNAFIAGCRQKGLRVHPIPERFAFDPAILLAIPRLIAALNPDIVQTHNVKSHFLMYLTAARRTCPWIAFHHGYTRTKLRMRLYNQLNRLSLPAADHVVTVCQPFAASIKKLGVPAERITIQHNSVAGFCPAPDHHVSQLRKALEIPSCTTVLLTVGRLSREKGHCDLIEAVARVHRTHPSCPFRLVVVGDGPELSTLKQLAVTLGVSNYVIFAGHQSNVNAYYTIADIAVLPSHSEGSPNALLEAMAAGLPIIATAVGGIPEIATPGKSALLVRSKDPGGLAAAICSLLNDGVLRRRLGESARARAMDFATIAYCDSMLSFYGRVLGLAQAAC